MKNCIDDLAMFGGMPAFPEQLHVGRPNVPDRRKLLERIEGMLDTVWFTNNGPLVQEFEQRLAEYVGVKHAVAMCNATVAQQIVTRAAGLTGEVIVPSFTFVATAHALQWQEITPVFCDIDPETLTLDPDRVEELITPRTSAIIGVHVFGRACAVDRLEAIADRHGLTLMFDAAHALACTWRGTRIGGFGRAEFLSFHATKFAHAFEGGAVTTNDDELAEACRLMRNFGFAGHDRVIHVGTNGKLTEVCAAMGLTSLDCLDQLIEVNRQNLATYRDALAGVPGLRLLEPPVGEQTNAQYVIVDIDENTFGLSRDALVRILHAENILVRRYFFPGCHRMEPYASLAPQSWRWLPVTERATQRVLSLPTGLAVSGSAITEIGLLLGFLSRTAPEVLRRI
ncbi:MAG: DegT/DnrJ/EryC1/StrS family aminotransferase [Planctomycetota bacterium]